MHQRDIQSVGAGRITPVTSLRQDATGPDQVAKGECWAVIFEDDLGADFGGRNSSLEQCETTDIKIGVGIAFGVEGRSVLDEYAVVIICCGVFNLVAGFNVGDGCNPVSIKSDSNIAGSSSGPSESSITSPVLMLMTRTLVISTSESFA